MREQAREPALPPPSGASSVVSPTDKPAAPAQRIVPVLRRKEAAAEPPPAAPAPAMNLAALATDIKRVEGEAHVGPIKAALRLVAIDQAWETYKEEAGGLSFEEWAHKVFGNKHKARNVRHMAQAVDRLKADGYPHTFATGTFDHRVLIYLTGDAVPKAKRKAMIAMVAAEQKARGNIVTYLIARAIVVAALGKQAGKRKSTVLLDVALRHIRACHEADEHNILPNVPAQLASLI